MENAKDIIGYRVESIGGKRSDEAVARIKAEGRDVVYVEKAD